MRNFKYRSLCAAILMVPTSFVFAYKRDSPRLLTITAACFLYVVIAPWLLPEDET